MRCRHALFSLVLHSLLDPSASLQLQTGWPQVLAKTSASASDRGRGASGPGGPDIGDKKSTRHRVAILTSGTLQRFMLGQVCTGLVEPLVQQGHRVDYYLTLNSGNFSSWHSEADAFMPELQGTIPKLQVTIRERIAEAGGTVRRVDIVDGVPLSKQDTAFLNRTRIAGAKNLVKKDKKLEELWEGLTQIERDVGQYTIVIILDDDSIWLRPFDLARLHASSERLHPQGYALDCSSAFHGKGMYPSQPPMFNDYIQILDREVAEPFGKLYSLLVSDSTYWSLKDAEHVLGRMVQRHNITLIRRPAGLVPVQRGALERDKYGNVSLCLHKLCDGEWGPDVPYMRPLDTMRACKSLRHQSKY